MTYAIDTLKTKLDDVYPDSGTIGYLCLLNDSLGQFTYTINTSTNLITTASAHGWATGTRVRGSTTGTQPNLISGSLSGSTDYFVRSTGATTLTLHPTLTDAQGNTNTLDFTDSGSGTLTLSEQALSVDDPIAVLVSHELNHPDYTRIPIADIGASSGTTRAEKPLISWVESVGSGNPNKVIRHVLVLLGGTSTPGNTTGTKDAMITQSTATTITAGNSQPFALRLSVANA